MKGENTRFDGGLTSRVFSAPHILSLLALLVGCTGVLSQQETAALRGNAVASNLSVRQAISNLRESLSLAKPYQQRNIDCPPYEVVRVTSASFGNESGAKGCWWSVNYEDL